MDQPCTARHKLFSVPITPVCALAVEQSFSLAMDMRCILHFCPAPHHPAYPQVHDLSPSPSALQAAAARRLLEEAKGQWESHVGQYKALTAAQKASLKDVEAGAAEARAARDAEAERCRAAQQELTVRPEPHLL